LVILEEAAYITEDVVKLVVLPTLTMRGSFLVVMSTRTGDENDLFSRMIRSKYLYNHEISYICKECLALGRTTTCIHKLYLIPPWQQTGGGLVAELFPDDEDAARENYNIMPEDQTKCFNRTKIDAFLARPRVQLHQPVRYVFMSFDPVTGADNPKNQISEFVITTVCGPSLTILGIEALEVHDILDYEPVLISLINRIRDTNYLQNAVIVVAAEAGTGLEASHIQSICLRFDNVICINPGVRKKGVNTTNALKAEAMINFRKLLDEDEIFIFEGFITHHKNPKALLEKLRGQCYKYERYVKVPSSVGTAVSVCYSGKGINKKEQDDLCITLQLAALTKHLWHNTPRYDKFRYKG
jgi:hypothetical protein